MDAPRRLGQVRHMCVWERRGLPIDAESTRAEPSGELMMFQPVQRFHEGRIAAERSIIPRAHTELAGQDDTVQIDRLIVVIEQGEPAQQQHRRCSDERRVHEFDVGVI